MGTGIHSQTWSDRLCRLPFPDHGHPWMPQRGMAYQPRATPWGSFGSQPVRSEGTPQRGGWGQRPPRVGMRRSFRTRGWVGWHYTGRCPGLVCAAPWGQIWCHWGGHWRWAKDKPSVPKSLPRCNLRKSYSGGNLGFAGKGGWAHRWVAPTGLGFFWCGENPWRGPVLGLT